MSKMKRKDAKLRLSPNEEARIIREEYDRRRKLRIQQVREQQRSIALQIRQGVEQRRQHELEKLEKELKEDWERQQREKLHTLQRLYQESLQLLGQGHRSAKENEPDLAAIAQREEENHVKAEERYREALKELKSQRLKDHERQSRSINARKKALQAEKERSAIVASLPPPLPNPIQSIDSKRPHVVKKSDVSAFSASHYHMPESTVDREVDAEQPNAHEGAELEVRRLQDLEREEKRKREEQLEKARLRGKEALRREHLVQDRERLLVELEHLQQTDLLRRRQQVSQMPPQIFQPLYKRQETREDFQREMEFAFEDMYTGERRVKGDLVVQLVPEPLPALSTGSQDQELDVTLDDISTQGAENTQHDTEQEEQEEQETSAPVEPSRPAPRRALKKLLDRIRSQRNQWTDRNSCIPAAESPTASTDLIPERDTTIDTGSLTSEEKDNLPPVKVPEPTHSPPAVETTEASTAGDPLLPVVLANRIQEFEKERRKREEELEREKQQQVVLLQELEEQKAKLEQLLLEAQQEREDLKATYQPEVPVRDQEVISVTPGPVTEAVLPAGENDHTRRIKEFQQQLLERNRIHQRTVEVARQRLEEYQKALRIRHNMTATSLLPSVLTHPPLHSAHSVHPPAPLQPPISPAMPGYIHATSQTSIVVPTKESDMLASTSRLPGSSGSPSCCRMKLNLFRAGPRDQRADMTALLTDSIMERVTEHLTQRVRPSSEPLSHTLLTTRHSASIPLQPTSDPIRAISPSTTSGAVLFPDHIAFEPGSLPHDALRTASLGSREDADMERQRRELLEVQRRMLEQREAVQRQQRQQEEERQRQEEQRQRQEAEMQQMRRQKETLQALIHTDAQPALEAASEVSENVNQTRRKLLASLLRAIEESHGGTLSYLEDPQETDGSPSQPPSNSAKPPVTRFRHGVMEMMTEQHELSAIQEVETPVNSSQVTGGFRIVCGL
ncbi:centrosomal protein of 295 kDa [Plectropomus leopardus]|uniref:centrosomal protein of 295 kDa n=1 Tax=Plectropomus leopardus TaxID=160734 RepID=UPI001C4C0310|nr:centrosomal protein of 295 kDa [Plectropomus leopardus]